MAEPRDTATVFARIAAEIEPLLIRLGRAAPGAELNTVRDEITALLDGAGLRWSDVAARVTAPSRAEAACDPSRPPPPPPESQTPQSSAPQLSPEMVLTNDELQRLGGYRTGPTPNFGHYGSGPIPNKCEVIPDESVEAAGDRLAYWAMAKSGQPFWQDPETGRGYLPGVTVPGKGKVQLDGRLGPLPVEG